MAASGGLDTTAAAEAEVVKGLLVDRQHLQPSTSLVTSISSTDAMRICSTFCSGKCNSCAPPPSKSRQNLRYVLYDYVILFYVL